MSVTIDQLTFPSDLPLRRRELPHGLAHPAKLHLGLLVWLVEAYTRPGDTIADPMIGIGGTALAALSQCHVIGREIEPRWLAEARRNAAHILKRADLFAGSIQLGQADAREPWGYTCDVALFSPPYGCAASIGRTAAGMLSERAQREARMQGITYSQRWRQFLETPTEGATGAIRFHYGEHPAQLGALRGPRYWAAMEQIYTQAYAAIRPGGLCILILKDHIRKGQRVTTADQTVALCESLGFVPIARHQRLLTQLSLWQRRRKERGEMVVEEEDVLVFRKG